jgi:hypothetical protein
MATTVALSMFRQFLVLEITKDPPVSYMDPMPRAKQRAIFFLMLIWSFQSTTAG